VVRPGLKDLLEALHIVDEVLEVDKKSFRSRRALKNQIKNFRADIAVSPHRSFRTARWVRGSGAPLRVGFQDLWSGFAYNKRVRRPNEKHDVLRQASLLGSLGFEVTSSSPGVVSYRVDGSVGEVILGTSLPQHMPFPLGAGFATLREAQASGFRPVVIAPGSQWKTKQWTQEGYTDLVREMLKRRKKVVLVGAPAERELCEQITSEAGNGAINLCGKTTISELAALMSVAEVVFCNDSGALHVASLAGAPVVTIFGPTVPSQGYAPWNPRARIVEESELGCRPCGAHGHQECPIGTHDCMKRITTARVVQAGDQLLRRG